MHKSTKVNNNKKKGENDRYVEGRGGRGKQCGG
jgi:hypothetical protein